MCGIAGAVVLNGRNLDQQAGCSALHTIAHRGPDAHGNVREDNVWLGHNRLSILDLSPLGNQPMKTEDGRYTISYNGEVYNYRELAAELALSNLRSHSDTEIILRAFEQEGVAVFRKLKGIFAFAIYDAKLHKIWLVRDRLGVKPLYYRLDLKGLAFGSEIKAVVAHQKESLVCNLSAMHEWLYYGNTLGGRTLYEGVMQLQPGCYLELDVQTAECGVKQYWSLAEVAHSEFTRLPSRREAIEETRRLLEEAVRRQLMSDVPVGVFLSGGIDSSAITAFAAKHYGTKLDTYAAGFDDISGADERPKARRVAEHFGTNHHEMQIGAGDVGLLVEKMVHHHDMPFADAANIPLFLMADRISHSTKVVLQGDGGDELFGGYRRYATLAHYRSLHTLAKYGRSLHAATPKSRFHHRVARYLNAYAAGDLATTMALLLTVEGPQSRPTSIFTPAFRAVIERSDPIRRYRESQRDFRGRAIGDQMSLVDMTVHLPDVFLEKVDRSTMAASLEVRVPFLDEDLVEYVAQLPSSMKIPGGRKKWLLKKALEGIVPDEILNAPKTGFSVPYDYWLRTSLKPMFFDHLATFIRQRPGVLEERTIREWFEENESGRRDRGFALWKIFNFMIWANSRDIRLEA